MKTVKIVVAVEIPEEVNPQAVRLSLSEMIMAAKEVERENFPYTLVGTSVVQDPESGV